MNASQKLKTSTPAKEPTKRLNADVPKSVYIEFAARAKQNDTTITKLVNQMITDYMGN